MTTVYEIPPEKMIEIVANDLKNKVKLKMPDWAKFVKTGAHKEKMPQSDDWWWIRAASTLRKVYVNGPVGVQRLRIDYGGKKNRGVKPEEFRKAGGKIIRTILQEFDGLGFTEKVKKGRKITTKGQSYLDKLASEFSKK
jgi:small subunit ribosomal protein S19e